MMATASALTRVLPFGAARSRRTWMALPATATDAEVVAYIRQGGTDGIAWLVERHSPRVYGYLLRLVKDPALAEDLLQDTWLRVVERLESYDARRPFPTWLLSIARHRAIDILRQQTRETHGLGRRAQAIENEEGEPVEPLEGIAAEAPSPLEQLAGADLEQRVADVFTRLPLHYREVLTLRFHQELRLEEIARILKVPLSTVKTRLQRGLILLRQRAEGIGLTANE
ncbi:RNA polymerase sigma factor [Acidobacteriia bacterium AH_259_A11_L15]|nr:RNA polymerase sigma factor [Acidobacteriia bacterium AH_259_A11_L15]